MTQSSSSENNESMRKEIEGEEKLRLPDNWDTTLSVWEEISSHRKE